MKIPSDALPPTDVDTAIDLLLRGEPVDVDAFIRDHPGLPAVEIHELRTLATFLGTSDPGDVGAPPRPERDVVGGFRLLTEIGAGAMGTVWLAEQGAGGRPVAIKLVRSRWFASPEVAARFRREAQALTRIRHPNVVGVIAGDLDPSFAWIAMDFIDGVGLDARIAESRRVAQPITVVDAVRWARDVALGLAGIHAAGLVHRDVKPSNIRLDPGGRAVLVDLGLARGASDATLTRSGAFVGTLLYAAPELVGDHAATASPASDVWSLGATLHETLTGAPPFDAPDAAALLRRIARSEPADLTALRRDVPRALSSVVQRALEKRPAHRYASAREFADDLTAVLELRPPLAARTTWQTAHRRWRRRHPRLSLAVHGAVLLVLAAIVWPFVTAGLRAWRVAAAIEQADAAAQNGDLRTALQIVAAAEVRDPDSPALSSRQTTWRSSVRRALAEPALALARSALGEWERAFAAAEDIRAGQGQTTHDITWHTAEPEALAAAEQSSVALPRRERETAAAQAAVFAQIGRVLTADPGNPEAAEIIVTMRLTEWRAAVARGAPEAEIAARADAVRDSDPRGSFAPELAGLTRPEFISEPPGAEVHVFVYREQTELAPGGAPRLVPCPVGGATAVIAPGTFCVRVERSVGDLLAGDLVTELAGQSVHEGEVVVLDGPAPLRRGDRLVTAPGSAVAGMTALAVAEAARDALGESAAVAEYRFQTRDGDRVIHGRSLAAAGISVGTATLALARGGCEVSAVTARGRRVTQVLPGGDFTPTFVPTPCPHDAAAGTTPCTATTALPRGSYLAVFHHPGCVPVRVPFVVPFATAPRVSATLTREDQAPPRCVWIEAGAAVTGGPLPTHGWALPEKTRATAGFWMAREETTTAEYFEFLNDAATLARIAATGPSALVPRPLTPLGRRPRAPDHTGRYVLAPGEGHRAVSGVSRADADAYCAWLTARDSSHGAFQWRLPTIVERERALRGADGRRFPYGTLFSRHCAAVSLTSGPGRDLGVVSPTAYAADESPYGVFALGGNVKEWVANVPEAPRFLGDLQAGGSIYAPDGADNEAFVAQITIPNQPHPRDGFRVIAVRGTESRR